MWERVRDLLDQRRLVDAVRDDPLDLVVVGDVQGEVDERPTGLALVVESDAPRARAPLATSSDASSVPGRR